MSRAADLRHCGQELQRQLLEKDQELFKAQEAHAYQRDAQEAEAAEGRTLPSPGSADAKRVGHVYVAACN